MTTDLIAWMDTSFRTMPYRDYRGLYGHSMGCYGSFRYVILHKDKFKAMAGSAGVFFTDTIVYMNAFREQVLTESGGIPPYFYNFYVPGPFTQLSFLACGAFAPDSNTSQNYINPPIVDYFLDDEGNYFDSVMAKLKEIENGTLIHQLSPSDSVGILHCCGTNDDLLLYPCHAALCDTMDMLGLPYEFFSHSGGHIDPIAFRQRALIFLDSLLLPPDFHTRVHGLADHISIIDLYAYPNPASGLVNAQYFLRINGNVELVILNHFGQAVMQYQEGWKPAGMHRRSIDISGLPAGLYFIRLNTGKESAGFKFIRY